MKQEQDWLARIQRQGIGRPEKQFKENALAVCSCGWIERSQVIPLSRSGQPMAEQARVHDVATVHLAMHVEEGYGLLAMDCDDVRAEIGAPEPDFYERPYLRCKARFYLLGDAVLSTAYNEHWDRCTVPEAIQRVAQRRTKVASETVYTPGDPILPYWKHRP